MVTGTGTLSIEETFLGPQALPPPPTRHALFAILIALAVLLHFGTIGIGDLYSETEGQYAAAAREMIQSGHYLLPTNDSIPRLQKPPLLYWLIVASYKVFGISTAATRVPIAFSVVATVAFTFLIGETAGRLLARIRCRTDLSHAHRHVHFRSYRHAGATLCRALCRSDLLRTSRVPAAASAARLVCRILDLRRAGMSNEGSHMDCFFRRRPLRHWRSFIVRRGCGFARFFGGLTCYFFSPSSDRGISGSKSILTGRFIASSLTSGLNICSAAILTGIGTTTFRAGNFSPVIWPGGFPGRWRFCRR